MRVGIAELIVALIVALVAVGPERLPHYAKQLGRAWVEMRKLFHEAAREISSSPANAAASENTASARQPKAQCPAEDRTRNSETAGKSETNERTIS